jgi:hypothetical protein
MTVKTRLARLEAAHVAMVKRAAVRSISTPATRAQAAAELDVWRRTMTDAAMLETMHEISARRLHIAL